MPWERLSNGDQPNEPQTQFSALTPTNAEWRGFNASREGSWNSANESLIANNLLPNTQFTDTTMPISGAAEPSWTAGGTGEGGWNSDGGWRSHGSLAGAGGWSGNGEFDREGGWANGGGHHGHHGRHHYGGEQNLPTGSSPSNESSALANQLLSDPTLLQSLQSLYGQMSPQGFAGVEQSLSQQLTANPGTSDSMLLNQALQQLQSSLPAGDVTALETAIANLPTTSDNPTTTTTTTTPPTGTDTPPTTTTPPTGTDTPPTTTTPPTGTDTPPPTTTPPTGTDTPPTTTTPPTGTDTPPTSIAGTGNYTVQNGKLYDPTGKETLLNGVEMDTDAQQALLNPTTAQAEIQQLKNGNFNFVRLGTGLVTGGSDWTNGNANLTDMETMANELNAAGIKVEFEYPIVNNASVLSGSQLTQAESWYQQTAQAFKNDPNVFISTPNESGDGSNTAGDLNNNAAWLAQTEGVLQAITSTGYKNAVVVDDTNWAGSAITGNPSSSALIQYSQQLHAIDPNLIAAEHDYQNSQYNGNPVQNLTEGISALQTAGYNPFIQEFDNYNSNIGSTQEGVNAVLSTATMQAGVGYSAFADIFGSGSDGLAAVWTGNNPAAAVIDPNGNLTAFGQQLAAQNAADQQYLASVNKGS